MTINVLRMGLRSYFAFSKKFIANSVVLLKNSIKRRIPYLIVFMLRPNCDVRQFVRQNFYLLIYGIIRIDKNLWYSAVIREVSYSISVVYGVCPVVL